MYFEIQYVGGVIRNIYSSNGTFIETMAGIATYNGTDPFYSDFNVIYKIHSTQYARIAAIHGVKEKQERFEKIFLKKQNSSYFLARIL